MFEGYGRLVGLALTGASGRDRLLPVSAFEKVLGEAPPAAPPQRVSVDEIYERALGVALQVIAARQSRRRGTFRPRRFPLVGVRRRPTARPTAHEDRIYFRCGLGRE